MSNHAFVQMPTDAKPPASGTDCATLVKLATLGAVVGGSVAAATNLQPAHARPSCGAWSPMRRGP